MDLPGDRGPRVSRSVLFGALVLFGHRHALCIVGLPDVVAVGFESLGMYGKGC